MKLYLICRTYVVFLMILLASVALYTQCCLAQDDIPESLKNWNIARPDYSELQGKDDAELLIKILEELRLAINDEKDNALHRQLPQEYLYPLWFVHSAQYISLLNETGCFQEAKVILDSFPESDGYHLQSRVYDHVVEKYFPPQPPKQQWEIERIAEELNSDQRFYSMHAFWPEDDSTSLLLSYLDEPNNKNATLPNSYLEWGQDFIKKHQPDLEKAREQVEKIKNQKIYQTNGDLLDFAVLFALTGQKDEADELIQYVYENTIQDAKRNYSYDENPEGKYAFIRNAYFWKRFVTTYMHISEHEKAMATLDDMRQTLTEHQDHGEEIRWRDAWNEALSYLIFTIATEKSLSEAMPYLDKIIGKERKTDALYRIADFYAKRGRKDDAYKIMEMDIMKNREKYDIQLGLLQYKMRIGNPEETLSAMKEYMEIYPHVGYEFGLKLMKLGDVETAKQVFARVNDQIKNDLEYATHNNVSIQHHAYVLAAQYKAGLKDESFEFAKSLRNPKNSWEFWIIFASQIADGSNKKEVKQLFDGANSIAMKIELSPGVLLANQSERFRHDYLWEIARMQLIAGLPDDAVMTINEAKKAQKNFPSDNIIVKSFPSRSWDNPVIKRMESWEGCVDILLAKNDITSAVIAADTIGVPQKRFQTYWQIIMTVLKKEKAT